MRCRSFRAFIPISLLVGLVVLILAESDLADAQRAPSAQKSVSFEKPVTNSSIGPYPDSVALGDLNGDGILDMVVASGTCSNCSGELNVLLGNGDGTFKTAVSYSPGGTSVGAVALGDFNGDGKLDIVVSAQCQDYGCVGVLLGNGDGTFQSVSTYNSGGDSVGAVAATDLNGDGKLDLVVTTLCENGGCIGVMLGNGDGTFGTAVTYKPGGTGAGSIALGDFNGDGKSDLVVATDCPDNGCIGVLLGNGDGTFQPAVTYNSGYSSSIALADVNGDGKLDVVVALRDSGGAGVILGNGDGTFKNYKTYGSGGSGGSQVVAIGDVNGDGHPDLVVSAVCRAVSHGGQCVQPSVAGILLGKGDGTFETAKDYSTGGIIPTSITIGDVNGDGRPDLIVANECPSSSNCTNGAIGVLLNKTARTDTTTNLTSSPNPSHGNQQVTFTATITSSLLIPDGLVVTFYNGTAEIGTSTTTNGVASLTTSFSKAKTYTIKAKYGGGGFLAASSGTIKQVVNP